MEHPSKNPEFWQEWINLLLGIWIFIAPWVLNFAAGELSTAAWDHWIVGALIFIVAESRGGASRRHQRRRRAGGQQARPRSAHQKKGRA